ncbi:MAG: DNA polymerase/3'-5' exonuclease PolX [Phycisphaerae bacterium]|nr:DNA polymerase/3'-5' exonuclease PolX [Phycisphaerae bacterium]
MINAELARIFDRIADLLEISGANPFRIQSHRRVSRTLKDLTDDVANLAEQGRLAKLPGVGKSSVEKIKEYLAVGKVPLLEELEAKLPAGLPDLLRIPGMGPKTIALAHHELGVGSIDDLKAAIESGRLAQLPGLGKKSVERIAGGIEFLAGSAGRTRLGVALPMAERLLEQVRKITGARVAQLAGSLRRGAETIGDVDILCEGDDGKAIIAQFVGFPQVSRVLAAGETKGSVTVITPDGNELQIDLRVVPARSFGAALQYFTGSKQHNVRLREIAVKRGLRLNEYGLFDGETVLAGEREEEIYVRLGLPCPPPELREDRGEFDPELARRKLLTLEDIRGDLHLHTLASDGRNTVEEMAVAARARGYKYIAITDHSRSSTITNGLTAEQLLEHLQAVREADRKVQGIEILAGTECDILSDGSLDYPDEVLAQCDFVVASIHLGMTKGKATPTERTLNAIANPWVTVIGHPTGRLINERAAMDIDIGKIIEAAAGNHTALELNASWSRLDLKDTHARQAIEAGVKLIIGTDAHSADSLGQMRYGVSTARRAGATCADVLNTRPVPAFKKWINKKRGL